MDQLFFMKDHCDTKGVIHSVSLLQALIRRPPCEWATLQSPSFCTVGHLLTRQMVK